MKKIKKKDFMEHPTISQMIVLSSNLEKRIEAILKMHPDLSLNIIVNQALEEWLNSSQPLTPIRQSFIIDESQGFGPRAIKRDPHALQKENGPVADTNGIDQE